MNQHQRAHFPPARGGLTGVFKTAIALFLAGLVTWGVVPARAAEFDHSHADWSALLGRHVTWIDSGVASQVDYAGFKNDKKALDTYLAALSRVSSDEFAVWSAPQQLAFLINAYNAFTVSLVLTAYPDLASIKDLGSLFRSPWKKTFFKLLGKPHSLDAVEHDMIRARGVYDDPRIHMAVNCAAIGCPALRNEAYQSDRLDAQLDDAVSRYLRDRARNRYDAATGTIAAGKIFDWYAEDFQSGYRGITSLKQFFSLHAEHLAESAQDRRIIREQRAAISFTPYDWRLNARP